MLFKTRRQLRLQRLELALYLLELGDLRERAVGERLARRAPPPACSACGDDPGAAPGSLEIPSGREPDASVRGSVTYRERITLTPGARLVVELRETSYADAPAPLIARHTIPGPGQVSATG